MVKLDDADAEILGTNKFKDFFKDFIQFWPNSSAFKALKMMQFFPRIFKDVRILFI